MKEGFWGKAVRRMDMPGEVMAGLTKIELVGVREIYIENHHGLLEYGLEEIHISCGEGSVKLTGEDFVIRAMTARELRLEGLLLKLEFIF
ncbi:MAG: sporulation protein [Oscillospiraceae bacterium]|nr:sporulation protein [Oscillospiraceae bacterium]